MQWNFKNKANKSIFTTVSIFLVIVVGNTINYLVHAVEILDYFIFLFISSEEFIHTNHSWFILFLVMFVY